MKIVVLSSYGIIPTAVEAIKSGATYYLTKLTDVHKVAGAFAREKGEANVELAENPFPLRCLEWGIFKRCLSTVMAICQKSHDD
jgi:two-component system response regulator RegA